MMPFPQCRHALAALLALALALSAPLAGARADEPNAPGLAAGKRLPPPAVEPVLIRGMRIEAIQNGRQRGLDQNGGYIAARDPKSGKEFWTLRVYKVTFDPKIERDVQDVFIESMTPRKGKLLVVDEKGRRYLVDVRNRTVRTLH